MDIITGVLQLIVALSLLNVWVVRMNQHTPYRGCDTSSLKKEFIAYGLPVWSFYVIGFIKITLSFLLILGLWVHSLVFPSALILSFIMLVAIWMHIKVKDPLMKSLPALLILLMTIGICIGSLYQT